MTQATTENVAPIEATAVARPLVPPDERFWKRYSPHHEFPWSTVAGIGLHLLAFALIFVFIKMQDRRSREQSPLSVGAIQIAGGGGDPNGEGDGPGKPALTEDTGPNSKSDIKPNRPEVSRETLKSATIDPLASPEFKGPDGRLLDDASDAAKRVAGMSEEFRKSLFAAAQGPKPGKGEGGTGSGGGKDKGRGTGQGDLNGPGKGNISVRQRRVLRWTVIFNTTDGYDYARQLAALRVIVAVPLPDGKHLVIRDLSRRPATGKIEDIEELNRMPFPDERPDSAQSLAMALGLRVQVERFIGFFPPELEQKLLELERRASGGKGEEQIRETRFRIVRRGRSYEPVVDSVR